MNRIALIGSGNAFFKDEGIGLYAAKYLKENYTFEPGVDIVDGGTLGFGLMPLLQEYDEVLIVNTASDEDVPAGTVTVRDCDTFLEGSLIKKTANEVEIAEMLQICSLTGNMAETSVVSIVPEDIISVEVGLSAPLRAAWERYIDTITARLAHAGVVCTKRTEGGMTMETILETFASPSVALGRGF
ncbi:hydrogenase maturation protease [Thiomicrolovo sp. ZZH C-3]